MRHNEGDCTKIWLVDEKPTTKSEYWCEPNAQLPHNFPEPDKSDITISKTKSASKPQFSLGCFVHSEPES